MYVGLSVFVGVDLSNWSLCCRRVDVVSADFVMRSRNMMMNVSVLSVVCAKVLIQSHTPDRLGKCSKRKRARSRIGRRRSGAVGPSPMEKVDGIQESGTWPAAREKHVCFVTMW